VSWHGITEKGDIPLPFDLPKGHVGSGRTETYYNAIILSNAIFAQYAVSSSTSISLIGAPSSIAFRNNKRVMYSIFTLTTQENHVNSLTHTQIQELNRFHLSS